MFSFLLSDLNFAFLQDLSGGYKLLVSAWTKKRPRGTHLFHDVITLCRPKGFLQIIMFGHLSLRDIHKDAADLQNVIDVRFAIAT